MKKTLIILFLMMLLLTGCMTGRILNNNYYILEYYEHSEKEELVQNEPINASVEIKNASIPQTYDRKKIVLRHFGPKITYSQTDFWGVDLDEITSSLLTQRLDSYNVFSRTDREFLNERPHYRIDIRINNIELYESEYFKQAHLNTDFRLSDVSSGNIIVQHAANREEVLLDSDISTFVQMINEIFLEESDRFIAKIIEHFKGKKLLIDEVKQDDKPDSLYSEKIITENKGMGLLLLPAISQSENEPQFIVKDQESNEIIGDMGVPLPLPKGEYEILYGSGNKDQLMEKKNIEIIPQYKTIVEPEWGCLVVDVVDEKRNFAKVRYEIFGLETGESYGSDFPVEEELGEQQKYWILSPGWYKITINNEPFNTYRNFATVYLEKGQFQKFTIVVERDEDGNPTNLVGAGVLEEDIFESGLQALKFSSAIHGNFNLNSNNKNDKDETETTITFNTQLDNHLVYDEYPFYYNLRNVVESGITRSKDEVFRISADDFDIKNTLIYYLIKNIGMYARGDVNFHLFEEKYYSSEYFNYKKIDKEGYVTEVGSNVDEVKIKDRLFPLTLKEGLGINWRILNQPKAQISLRTGFGMRQEFNSNVYNLTGTVVENNVSYKIFNETENIFKEGTEISVVANFKLPYDISYNTNFDYLLPFDKDEAYSMEWENIFNLKLLKYLSVDYRLKLENREPDSEENYISTDHSLFLRLTYFLR
ncbi:MAG: ABC-type transport auxiliary lipoprotein family protein [Candidatus Cloacimonadota bacterium]|nr:ABC-type transport auxiliary lipoprotein family protein [Candidatus Cloacimonadota bacterium]